MKNSKTTAMTVVNTNVIGKIIKKNLLEIKTGIFFKKAVLCY